VVVPRLIGLLPIAGKGALIVFAGWAVAGWAGAALLAAGLTGVVVAGNALWTVRVTRDVAAKPRRKRLSSEFGGRLAELGEKAGFETSPDIGFIDGPPNAFAWGPPHAPHLVVAESLHDLLSERQLLAVLAHELAHVRAGDARRLVLGELFGRLSYAAALLALLIAAAAFVLDGRILAPAWAWWGLAFGPTLLSALHHFLSRRAEFRADVEASRLTGDPAALSQALARIQWATSGHSLKNTIEEFAGITGRGWWRTHPAVEDRINRLQRMAGRQAV